MEKEFIAIFLIGIVLFVSFMQIVVEDVFGIYVRITNGTSMLPKYGKSSIVLCLRQRDYDVGDVIVFKFNETKTIFHRVVSKNHVYYVTKGDNVPIADGPVAPEKVICKVVWHINIL